jgi:hypothetical protein
MMRRLRHFVAFSIACIDVFYVVGESGEKEILFNSAKPRQGVMKLRRIRFAFVGGKLPSERTRMV